MCLNELEEITFLVEVPLQLFKPSLGSARDSWLWRAGPASLGTAQELNSILITFTVVNFIF